MTGLPNAFTERMGRQLGKGLPDFLRAMEEAPVRGIRMNVRKPFEGADDFTAGERIPWAEDGYYLPADSIAGAKRFSPCAAPAEKYAAMEQSRDRAAGAAEVSPSSD